MKKTIQTQKLHYAQILIFLHIIFATVMLQAQNTSLPVGAIPGAIDVSPMGATTYSIPIEVVSGTQGMQPNLSIVYNSMSGMGLLGMKWNMAGLSAITRCGKTPYYDNDSITAIQFNSDDRFAIDGSRLVLLSGVYGAAGAQYATEMEDFTRYFSYSDNHIKAFTDDGAIIEYGNSSNSKQKVGDTDSVLSWCINKITDANGNYITYHYGGTGGEIWIDSIKYTGNSGITPYAKVAFGYTVNPLNQNTVFVGGYSIPQTKLLKTITISYKDTIVRKYEFDYNLNISGETTAHLKEIVLYGEGETQQLNSTSITWGDPNINLGQAQTRLFNYPVERFISGDFNGDGYQDYVEYGTGTAKNTWKLYTYNPETGNFDFSIEGVHQSLNYLPDRPCCCLYAADVNGDGCDELIIANRYYFGYETFLIVILSLKSDKDEIASETITYFQELLFGDFDGDGRTDILFVRKDENDKYKFRFFFNSEFLEENFLIHNFSPPFRVRVADFNGDGRSEFEVLTANNRHIYHYSNGGNPAFIRTSYSPEYTGIDRYFGDFNGDGIADLLTYDINDYVITWKLYFGKGDGTFTNATTIDSLNSEFTQLSGKVVPKYKILIADINGDGKDDIIQPCSHYDGQFLKTMLRIIYSEGCIDGQFQHFYNPKILPYEPLNVDIENYHLCDINHDGILNIVIQDTLPYIYHEPYAIYLFQNKHYEFVKGIEDGMGKRIELTYKNKYFMAKSSSWGSFSCRQRKYFFPVVNSIAASNGIGNGLNTLYYKYYDAVYSLPRKTFLGFEGFTGINNLENKKDSCNFLVDSVKHILIPATQTSYCGNQKTNEKIYTVELKELNGRFAFNYNFITNYDCLSNAYSLINNILDGTGRLSQSNTKTYNTCNAPANSWLHSETKNYTYTEITLSGNQKKTVPTKVMTAQQYANSNFLVVDTVLYGYYTDTQNKGRLKWVRNGNIDGSITTTCENYTTAGLYQQKSVSSPGCTTRTENFTYDATQRFVMQVTNQLKHKTSFIYNLKTGNKLSETDPNRLTTSYQYDTFGNLKKIIYSDGTVTKDTAYWCNEPLLPNAKYKTYTTSAGKPELEVYYDVLGREVCRYDDGYYFKTIYNTKGQVEKTMGPHSALNSPESEGITHKYCYDGYGRKISEKASYISLSYSYNKRKVTVTDSLRNNLISWKNSDALGRIDTAYDAGGTITYNYAVITENNKPRHRTTITSPGTTTVLKSDLWGNRLSINEPNAGIITSIYNGFNELIKQIDARGDTTKYEYDNLGRVTKKQFSAPNEAAQIIEYEYDSAVRGIGKLARKIINNNLAETFRYNTSGRLSLHAKIIDNFHYCFNYSYTPDGQLQKLTYPGGFAVTYNYTSTGKLSEIRRTDDNSNSLIYKVNSRNRYHAPNKCEYGNELATEYTYNPYGLLTRIKTGNTYTVLADTLSAYNDDELQTKGSHLLHYVDSTILNYRYAYDNKGLMSLRSESVLNCLEQYEYDHLDRLTQVTSGKIGQVGTPQIFSYDNNGNITDNTQLGIYSYEANDKPHAVKAITSNAISASECAVTYNFFNQPTQITEGVHQLDLCYDSNQQRQKSIHKNNGINDTCYYAGKYFERKKDSAGIRHYNYIYGDNGVVALYIHTVAPDTTGGGNGGDVGHERGGETDSIYYIHTDHLGSYCAITSPSKRVVQRNYFDPWGNYPTIFASTDGKGIGLPPGGGEPHLKPSINFALTHRGFTGHEHYPYLKIINMNGRLYDPVIARFFSPDNFVQLPEFTQSFNKYSYCLNNPLHYTDPSGQFIWNTLGNGLFFPARIFSEATTWVNDKINGIDRPNGYFNTSYLTGQTEPGAPHTIYPCTQLSYGQPGYISQRAEYRPIGFGTDWGRSFLGADNEFHNLVEEWEEKPYERKEGSRKLMWLSKKAAASGGVIAKTGKFISGTYVGKFEGVNIFETKKFGSYTEGSFGATIPELGIIIGEGIYKEGGYNRDKWLLRHEFGHILQYRKWEASAYWNIIAKESVMSAGLSMISNWDHDTFWTETYANYLSSNYFTDILWNNREYPAQDINWFNRLRLILNSKP
jgi:RHS repeat-associated protein